MNALAKSMLVAVAAGGLLAGCATYDYGYGYSYNEPYYYGYDYGYGPNYYDYGYSPYYYGPSYYVGPSVGLGFTYRDRDHDRRYRHSERHRTSYNGTRGHRSNVRPTVTRSQSRTVASTRGPSRHAAPAPTQAHRGYAPNSLLRAEQQ